VFIFLPLGVSSLLADICVICDILRGRVGDPGLGGVWEFYPVWNSHGKINIINTVYMLLLSSVALY